MLLSLLKEEQRKLSGRDNAGAGSCVGALGLVLVVSVTSTSFAVAAKVPKCEAKQLFRVDDTLLDCAIQNDVQSTKVGKKFGDRPKGSSSDQLLFPDRN